MDLKIVSDLETYCTELLSTSQCAELPFHNLLHTKEVVSNVKVISNYLQLTREETEPIVIAAWFHDCGFSKAYQGHEDVSQAIAFNYLKKIGYGKDKIDAVLAFIAATEMPQRPLNRYAEVLCDADVFHIGTPNFFFKKLLLRRE